jgi:hypothetical protein
LSLKQLLARGKEIAIALDECPRQRQRQKFPKEILNY